MSYAELDLGAYGFEKDSENGTSEDHLLPSTRPFAARPCQRSHRYLRPLTFAAVAILAYLLGGFSVFFLLNSDAFCTRHVSRDSPLLNDVKVSYATQHFNGSLFKENVFRRTASPEVDDAWESLGVNYRSVAIPEEHAKQAGLRSDQVKINRKYGGGYPANVEGLHQLHCLNLVRQSLYYNYDYYKAMGKGAFLNEDYVVRVHVSHCLDIVRQQLMCTIDIGFLGQIWTNPDAPRPFVDFNTKHKCRNFETVRHWAEQHQLPEITELAVDFLEPPRPGDFIYDGIP